MSATYELRREQWVPAPPEQVFPFFADAANLAEITPDWLDFRILTPRPIAMRAGAKIEYEIGWHFVRMRWYTVIAEWQPPERFVDVQTRGPYRSWRHTHSFVAQDGGTLLSDRVEYSLPFGVLGRLAHSLRVRRDLERIFDYRTERIRERFNGPSSRRPPR